MHRSCLAPRVVASRRLFFGPLRWSLSSKVGGIMATTTAEPEKCPKVFNLGQKLKNAYCDSLPEIAYSSQKPSASPKPNLVEVNDELARALGLDPARLRSPEGICVLAGNTIPEGGRPISLAYAGHQFGNWVPSLGDGRAVVLGDAGQEGRERLDLQLKGSGVTPYSRAGDGKAALGPVMREYVLSEAMHALHIPTTRALAMVTTGEQIERFGEFHPGAILTRVASSLVRVGTFEYFYARGKADALRALGKHLIERNFPELKDPEQGGALKNFTPLFTAAMQRQAKLVARWAAVGFIHGVMNTDNMSVVGDTIDYGPAAFMDYYRSDMVHSSIDLRGRYAFGKQPGIAHWNLSRLLICMSEMMDLQGRTAKDALEKVNEFPIMYAREHFKQHLPKIGFEDSTDEEKDQELCDELLLAMQKGRADFTLTFRRLSDLPAKGGPETDGPVRELFDGNALDFDKWAIKWRSRLADGWPNVSDEERSRSMRKVNPAFIPRNHVMEEVLEAAREGDMAPFRDWLDVLKKPFDDHSDLSSDLLAKWSSPPPRGTVVRTFCGT